VLPHQTNKIIIFRIIKKILNDKSIVFEHFFLFFMKVRKLYKRLNIIYFHKIIIFFAAS